MQTVKEDYCSKEVGKLLRDKGFEQVTDSGWVECPTHALAIKWIRENFDLHISTDSNEVGKWCYHVRDIRASEKFPLITNIGKYSVEDYKSPEEATEAALKYTLNNLI